MSHIGWDLDGGSGKVEFTKFPVGQTEIRVVDPAPLIRWVHWLPQFNKSVNCPGVKVCPIDDIINKAKANGEKAPYNSVRKFAMNVYNYTTGRMEVMEQGKTFMEDLKLVMDDMVQAGKQLSDVVLKVRRTGTGKDDTKYRIDVVGDAPDALPTEGIVDLKDYFKPATPQQITALLNVRATTRDEYNEAWNAIMTQEEKDTSSDEEIEVD